MVSWETQQKHSDVEFKSSACGQQERKGARGVRQAAPHMGITVSFIVPEHSPKRESTVFKAIKGNILPIQGLRNLTKSTRDAQLGTFFVPLETVNVPGGVVSPEYCFSWKKLLRHSYSENQWMCSTQYDVSVPTRKDVRQVINKTNCPLSSMDRVLQRIPSDNAFTFSVNKPRWLSTREAKERLIRSMIVVKFYTSGISVILKAPSTNYSKLVLIRNRI